MTDSLNAECLVCGKKYHCCLSCEKERSFRPWRSITDTIEHYKIHLILCDYHNGNIDKMEAKELLSRVSFDMKELRESVQTVIKDIIGQTV